MLNLIRFLLLAVLATLSSAAQSVIVDGTFSGTVTSSYDFTGDFSGFTGEDTLVGHAVTGLFSFDTELAPNDSWPNDPHVGAYETATPTSGAWLSMSINVGGFEIDLSSTDWFRSIYVQPVTPDRDYFTVGSDALDEEPDNDPETDSYYYRHAYAGIGEFVGNLFDDDSLPTTLEWADNDVSDDTERSGLGFFSIKDFVKRFPSHPLGEGFDYDYDAYGLFNVAYMAMDVRAADATEPSVIGLIVAGLIGVGFTTRRRACWTRDQPT